MSSRISNLLSGNHLYLGGSSSFGIFRAFIICPFLFFTGRKPSVTISEIASFLVLSQAPSTLIHYLNAIYPADYCIKSVNVNCTKEPQCLGKSSTCLGLLHRLRFLPGTISAALLASSYSHPSLEVISQGSCLIPSFSLPPLSVLCLFCALLSTFSFSTITYHKGRQ